MRIEEKCEKISYVNTLHFFENRAKKYNHANPYAVTMYQDDNPDLVLKRNEAEINSLLPYLKLDSNSTILDLACGIGRWSDAISIDIKAYVGIDFCDDFIKMAQLRSAGITNRHFFVANSLDLKECLTENNIQSFNRVLMIGSLMYLNDKDLINVLKQVNAMTDQNSMIIIREPIAIRKRLTLKDQYSDELMDEYNAIYRTRDELFSALDSIFICNGFKIIKEDYLFGDTSLNNRKETVQYYFVLERQ